MLHVTEQKPSGLVFKRLASRAEIYWRDTLSNPLWPIMFAASRFGLVRKFLRGSHSDLALKPAGSASIITVRSPDSFVQQLHAQGLAEGLCLNPTVVDAIKAFAEIEQCRGSREGQPFLPNDFRRAQRTASSPILVGHYFEAVEKCEAAVQLRSDPLLQAIAAAYLGNRARPVSTRLWWSFPSDSIDEQSLHSASQERFHYDVDDWRALKVFFYLTEVGEKQGPHVYVRRSHKAKPLRHEATLLVGKPTDDVLRVYGVEAPAAVTGGAGSGFFMDPFGFHMGTLVRTGRRLMLEIAFGVSNVNARRFNG